MGRDRTHHIYAAFFVLYYFRSLDGRSYLLVVADSKNVVSVLSGPSLVPGSARCLQMSLLLSISMILSDIELCGTRCTTSCNYKDRINKAQ